MEHETRNEILAGAVLLVLACLCCLPALQGTWLVDDANYIVDNANLRSGAGLWRIWSDPQASNQYYPLVYTTFWLEYQAWGLDVRGYHLVNLLLHALNVLLLWRILRHLGLPGAWLVAAVFAVHPIHVESVAWITERKNVLATAGYLLAGWSYLRWEDGHGRRDYVVALLAFLAALLAKTPMATLPAALLLVRWWRQGRLARRDVVPTLPFFALGAVLGLFTVWLERTHVGATGGVFDLSVAQRVLVAGRALWHYAAKIVWPSRLVFDYGRWDVDVGDPGQWIYPAAALAVVVALWAGRRRWGRGPVTGVLYFAGTLFPALGFFNLFFFRYSFVADHFVYPASVGLIALVVWGLHALARRRLVRPIPAMAAGLLLLVLVVGSWRQAGTYVSMEALCRHILEGNADSWLGHNNLGDELMKRGELDEARLHLEAAQRLAPDRLETQLNLAILAMNTGRYAEAVSYGRRAVDLGPHSALGHAVLGDAYLRAGEPRRAVAPYEAALARDPGHEKARVGLGSALAQLGRFAEATLQLQTVLDSHPGNVTARTNLAICLANLGRYDEAVVHLEAVLAVEPDNAAVRNNLDLVRQRAGGEDGG